MMDGSTALERLPQKNICILFHRNNLILQANPFDNGQKFKEANHKGVSEGDLPDEHETALQLVGIIPLPSFPRLQAAHKHALAGSNQQHLRKQDLSELPLQKVVAHLQLQAFIWKAVRVPLM